MIAALWSRLFPYLLVALAVVSVLFGLYAKGRRAGREAEQRKGERKVLKARETRDDVETDNRNRDADAIAGRLRQWQRD
jgi:hypothetical protein